MFWCVPACARGYVYFWEAHILTKTQSERKSAARRVTGAQNIVGFVNVLLSASPLWKSLTLGIKRLIWKVTSCESVFFPPVYVNKSSSALPLCQSPILLFSFDLSPHRYNSSPPLWARNGRQFFQFYGHGCLPLPSVALSDSLIKLGPCSEWKSTDQPSTKCSCSEPMEV